MNIREHAYGFIDFQSANIIILLFMFPETNNILQATWVILRLL